MKISGITLYSDKDFPNNGIQLYMFGEPRYFETIDFRNDKCTWWTREGTQILPDGYRADAFPPNTELGVRPLLLFVKDYPQERIPGLFLWGGLQWVVISDNSALCTDIVGASPFRVNWKDKELASEISDYETSDIKKWLDKWYRDRLLAVKESKKNSKN